MLFTDFNFHIVQHKIFVHLLFYVEAILIVKWSIRYWIKKSIRKLVCGFEACKKVHIFLFYLVDLFLDSISAREKYDTYTAARTTKNAHYLPGFVHYNFTVISTMYSYYGHAIDSYRYFYEGRRTIQMDCNDGELDLCPIL